MRPGIDLEGKRVLVVGLARTGIASALFSAAYGATVTATDEKTEAQLADTAARLRAAGVRVEVGGHSTSVFVEQDLIIVSPGVSSKLPALDAARARKIPVWSEIELAWRFLRGTLIAITGSNGKTTTTSLVAHILQTAKIPTLVGGNIGTPLLSRVEFSTDSTVTVAEISSFQLENIEAFRPEIGLLLNITPDHLDRYAGFNEYASAKMRMFENQLDRDFAVLNADDPQVAQRLPARPQVYWFSRTKRLAQGAFLRDNQIFFRSEGTETALLRRDEIPLKGEHNVENVLAACAAAWLAGADAASIAAGVRSFTAVEHRIEFVANINNVAYYNDSKATNVDATLKAVEAFPGPLIVILGGKDKGSDYTVLRDPLRSRARLALLIGAAAEKIASQIGDAIPFEHAGTLDRAVRIAHDKAQAGDTVLLAPACASFDQFENFEHRGRVFKEAVQQLAAESANAAVRKG